MSKILSATCVNNEVTIEGQKVESTILSQGKAQSSGKALIEGSEVTYVTSNASDVAQTIEKVCEMIDAIALILTSIGSGMTGPETAPPGTLATDVAQLQLKSTELLALKDNLK